MKGFHPHHLLGIGIGLCVMSAGINMLWAAIWPIIAQMGVAVIIIVGLKVAYGYYIKPKLKERDERAKFRKLMDDYNS